MDASSTASTSGYGGKPLDENGEHLLERSWSLWVHKKTKSNDYSKALVHISDFSTVEQFWRLQMSIPEPSRLLYTAEEGYKTTPEGEIEGFSLFVKGCKPQWEDAMNQNGGEYHLRKFFTPGQLDKTWLNLCLALIGENIDPIKNNEICGVRLVDKSQAKPAYRFEVWYKTKNSIEEIKEKLEIALNEKLGWEIKRRS